MRCRSDADGVVPSIETTSFWPTSCAVVGVPACATPADAPTRAASPKATARRMRHRLARGDGGDRLVREAVERRNGELEVLGPRVLELRVREPAQRLDEEHHC